jgi:hypothetical protein
MPNITVPINDLMNTVERQIVYDVLRQFMELTGIPEKTLIRFFGEDAGAPQWNTGMGPKSEVKNIWPHLDHLYVEVEEDFDPDRVLSTAVAQEENPYIFTDQNLKVVLKPVYSPTNIVIRVTYRGVDKNEASRWRNSVRVRISQGGQINMHRITYNYELPPALEGLLMHIFDLRSNVASYNDTIDHWWAMSATPKFTVKSTQAGTHPTIAVAETQSRIQGIIDFDGNIPEKQVKSAEADMWEVSFSYKFSYDKPIAVNARYPMLVHQQLIGDVFRQYNDYKAQDDILRQLSLSMNYLQNFQGDIQLAKRLANRGMTLPIEDDWMPLPATIPSCTVRVFTALCNISEADKRFLLDIRQLGDYSLIKPVLDFMAAGEYSRMNQHAASIFQVTVYEGTSVLHTTDIEVTSDLKVMATRDLDLRKVYHVRLGMHAVMVGLQQAATGRIRNFPGINRILANALNGALTEYGNSPDLRKNALNEHDLRLLGLGNFPFQSYSFSLFQSLFIAADRMENYKPEVPTPVAIEHPFVNV